MPPNMPPAGQQPNPYGPPYPYYAPPMGMVAPPPRPPQRGLHWWQWLLIVGSGVLVATCVLGGSLYGLGVIAASRIPTPSAFQSLKAQIVANGTLSFSGTAGEAITQGKSYSYSTSKGDALIISASSTGSSVIIDVTGYNGDTWTLDFEAPGTVQPINGKPAVLVPGTYSDAHMYPFNGNSAGLSLRGTGRQCSEVTGSFTISAAVFGPPGYVRKFDATFVQHCGGAVSGQVHISNPPAR